MLVPDATYPYPGSYALLVDTDLPESEQRAELVRIMWRRSEPRLAGMGEPTKTRRRPGMVGQDDRANEQIFVAVSFPLRDGASGNKLVAESDLIDATPLAPEDAREFHDLDRALAGRSLRTAKQKREKARRDRLHSRMVWSSHMERLLRRARAIVASQRRAA